MSIIAWLVIGAIAGWVAGKIVPGDEGYGVIGTIIAGVIGALVGGWLLALLTGNEDWLTGIDISTLLAAIVGAVIVVFAWQMIWEISEIVGDRVLDQPAHMHDHLWPDGAIDTALDLLGAAVVLVLTRRSRIDRQAAPAAC